MGLRHRFAAWVINNRNLSLAILLAITAFFAVGLTKVQVKTIFSDLFPKDHPFVQTYKAHNNFGNPLTVVLPTRPSRLGGAQVLVLAQPQAEQTLAGFR